MSKFLSLLKLALLAMVAIVFLSSPVFADDEEEEDPLGLDLSNTYDFKTLSGAESRLAPHGNDLMGDMIDKNTGGISFQHTDISIPGNSGLEVALKRKVSQGSAYYSPFQQAFGDWVLDIPIAYISYGLKNNNNPVFSGGCLNGLGSMAIDVTANHSDHPFPVSHHSHVSGSVLHVPGKSLSGFRGDVKTLADPAFDWTSAPRTTDHAGRCATQVIAPDGTKYKFGRHAFRAADQMRMPFFYGKTQANRYHELIDSVAVVNRKNAVYLITEVEDVEGNWVRYDYTNNSSAELTRIFSNDGREIVINYSNAPSNNGNFNSRFISHIEAHGRRWDYTIAAHDSNSTGVERLQRVSLPDGRFWQFGDAISPGLSGIQFGPHTRYKCVPFETSFNLKHPDGAVGTFEIRETRHLKNATTFGDSGDDDSPPGHFIKDFGPIPHYTDNSECNSTAEGQRPEGWPYYQAMSVVSKEISGANIPTATWDFQYRDYSGGLIDNNWTTITEPDGIMRTYTYQAVGYDRGLLKSVVTKNSNNTTIESLSYEHNSDGDGATGGTYGQCRADGDGSQTNAGNCQVYKKRPVTKMVQVRDGDTYTTEYDYDFSVASSPLSVTKYTSINQSKTPRVTTTTYEDKLSNWILDLPKTVSLNDREEVRTQYNTLGQLTSYEKYGQKVYDYTYNTDGTLASITDALQRRTEASDWKRGTPQHIKRAVGTLDEIDQYQYVDDNGWLTSSIDANNNSTSYDHDTMGRMTKVTPPIGWDSTDIDYDFPSDGGAVLTISKGQSKTTVTYDSMYRERLEQTQALDTGWSSYVNTTYDALGRVAFKSQPSDLATETKGVETTYDGLGRVFTVRENVAPYATTTHKYLTNHRHRVTDPAGEHTDYYSYGYDGPNNKDYRIINRYNAGILEQRTDLFQNEFGQLTRLRQFGWKDGNFTNQSQHFYYDDRQRLCRHQVPEHRATRYQYDAAGQMVAYAKGQSNSGCGNVPDVSAKVSLSYDELGRLKKTDFYDADTPDIERTYDDNGNLRTLNRGEESDSVNWTYVYNNINMLTHEKLEVDNRTYNNAYVYNRSGHLKVARSPYQRIDYTLDGLGRMQTVKHGTKTLASSMNYHDNGALHQMTYGNNHYFSQTLNDRLLPERVLSYSGATKAIDQTLSYDVRGLVTSIIDGAVNDNDRDYTYDGLGYLKTASGPWGEGAFKYDSLGNLRQKTLGTRTVDVSYDTFNRAVQSDDSNDAAPRTLAYDARGNVTTLGQLAFYYDMSDQPTIVTGSSNGDAANGNYLYDGNMKRVRSIINGKTIYNIYNQAGQLVTVHKKSEGEIIDYVQGPAGTLARIKKYKSPANAWVNEYTYLHPDHLGSAQAGTKDDGTIAWREQYTPFGEQLQNPTANDNLDGFTGHIKDSDTGLNYMQARYYDPVIGRFLSVDPVTFLDTGNPGMFGRYTYTHNDPINGFDPDGRQCRTASCLMLNMDGGVKMANGGTYYRGTSAIGASNVAAQAADIITDPIPVISDVKDIVKAGANPTRENILAAGVGLVPTGGDIAKQGIKHGDEAKSALSGLNLQKQLASESQMADLASGGGIVLSQPAKQAQRIAAETGGNASDIQKVSSGSFVAKDGQTIQTHAFRDASNNTLIQAKTIINENP